MLSQHQMTALEYAASPQGGWPRSKETAMYRTIRSYKSLEKRKLVRATGLTKIVKGVERVQFVATDAGLQLLS